MLPIEVATHEHPEASTGAAAALFVELEHDALEGVGVVAGDDAFLFMAEDLREVVAQDGHERAVRIGGRPTKRRVVRGGEVLPQGAIGGRQGPDPGHAELGEEPALQRAVGALAAAPGLRREAHAMLYTQPGE